MGMYHGADSVAVDRSNDFLRTRSENAEKPEGCWLLWHESLDSADQKRMSGRFRISGSVRKNLSLDHDSARGAASAAKPRLARWPVLLLIIAWKDARWDLRRRRRLSVAAVGRGSP